MTQEPNVCYDVIAMLYDLIPQEQWPSIAMLSRETFADYKFYISKRPRISTMEALKRCIENNDVVDYMRSEFHNDGETIYWGFRLAAKFGNSSMLALMIQKSIENDRRLDRNDGLAWARLDWNDGLRAACEYGHMEMIELMIEHGATDWNDGLFKACEYGHMNIIELMIEHGATDCDGGLFRACKIGRMDIIELMIEHGAKNWNEGLRVACYSDHVDVAKLMIRKGAN